MEKNKYTLITIVVLLVLIVPFTIYGTYKHFITTTNFKRKFRFNGKLYFYSEKKLLGTYTCKNKNCDYATYQDGQKAKVINNSYVFILDGDIINLVNINSDAVTGSYDAVYTGEDNRYYVQKGETWGAISILNVPSTEIDPSLGYSNIRYHNGKYIVTKDSISYILDKNKVIFQTTYEIKDFNDKYIVVRITSSSCPMCTDISSEELLYDYSNTRYFMDADLIDEITLIDNYVLINVDNYNYLYNIVNNEENLIDSFYYYLNDSLKYEINSNNIIFKDENGFEKTIELNN